MKRIAFIHENFPMGGAEKVTIDISNQLLKKYDDYEILVLVKNYHKEKIVHIENPSHFHILTPGKDVDNYQFADFIVEKCMREEPIDIFVFPNINIDGLAERLHKLGGKTIFAVHNTPLWEIDSKRMRKKSRVNKNIWKKLEYYLLQYLRYEVFNTLSARYIKLYKKNLERHDVYMVLCEADKKFMIDKFGVSSDKVDYIDNMVYPVANINYAKKNQFVYVGRLSYHDKRVDRLINAWKIVCDKLSDWKLIIIGEGPDSERLKSISKDIPRVEFTGYSNNTSAFYNDASVLCMTSVYEGVPICMLEAQANGVIPIVMDCNSAGVRSLVEPTGENGFLVPKGDVEAFAKQMIEFANLSEDEKLQLRRNVVKKSQEYSPEKIGERWHKLFSKLLQ